MENQWKQILGKLKQAGDDLRNETQKLVEDIRDPKNQEKVRDSLKDFGHWAKGTAEEAAHRLESAVKTLEDRVQRASEAVNERLGRASTVGAAAKAKIPAKKKSTRKTATKKRPAKTAAKSRKA